MEIENIMINKLPFYLPKSSKPIKVFVEEIIDFYLLKKEKKYPK